MGKRVFIPGDTSSIALLSDEVAEKVRSVTKRRGIGVEVVRNGSRGLYWLEPLLEVETPAGRIAYGPVSPDDVESLFNSNCLEGGGHPLFLGPTEDIPNLKKQERVTFKRVGVIDPLSIDDYRRRGGYTGLERVMGMAPREVVEEIKLSGLRGRGGAAFPTGVKWETALTAVSPVKYIICNADEGDSGSFSDRMIMEGDPFALIEGMTIAAVATGAKDGYVYLRSEYPYTKEKFRDAIEVAYGKGCLGEDILRSGRRFDLHLVIGAGSYVCGEETALVESLENRRGMVRPRPPVPAVSGLFGMPTILNNVITFATVTAIFERGWQNYRTYGTDKSSGTLPFQLSGNIRRAGLVEVPFGTSLRELVYGFGEGTASGRKIKGLQIGGPLGAYFPASVIDRINLTYEDLINHGGILGHGGIVVFDDTVNMADMAKRCLEFVIKESCGKCVPCRLGSTRSYEFLADIVEGREVDKYLGLLKAVFKVSSNLSLCGLGGMMHLPVESLLKYFPGDFGLKKGVF